MLVCPISKLLEHFRKYIQIWKIKRTCLVTSNFASFCSEEPIPSSRQMRLDQVSVVSPRHAMQAKENLPSSSHFLCFPNTIGSHCLKPYKFGEHTSEYPLELQVYQTFIGVQGFWPQPPTFPVRLLYRQLTHAFVLDRETEALSR